MRDLYIGTRARRPRTRSVARRSRFRPRSERCGLGSARLLLFSRRRGPGYRNGDGPHAGVMRVAPEPARSRSSRTGPCSWRRAGRSALCGETSVPWLRYSAKPSFSDSGDAFPIVPLQSCRRGPSRLLLCGTGCWFARNRAPRPVQPRPSSRRGQPHAYQPRNGPRVGLTAASRPMILGHAREPS